jgi:tetratricopeptide (TPR) repeat protein
LILLIIQISCSTNIDRKKDLDLGVFKKKDYNSKGSTGIPGNKDLEYRFISNLINMKYEKAEHYLTKLEKEYDKMNDSQKCDYHFYKGSYLWSIKEFIKAENEFSNCLNINNAYVQALYARANLYTFALENDQAMKEDLKLLFSILKYVKNNSPHENPTISLYSINAISRKYTKYVDKSDLDYNFVHYTKSLDDLMLDTLGRLQTIEKEEKNYNHAIKYIYEMLKFPDASIECRQKLGDYYLELKQYKEALENYTIYLSNPESSFEIHQRRGLCYFHLGSYKEALLDFNQTLIETDDPEKSSNISFLKNLLEEKNSKYFKLDIGYEKDIEQQIQLVKDVKSSALFYKAKCFEKLNQIDKAISGMTELIHFNSEYELAYYYRGYYFNEIKELTRAIDDFKKALELNSELTQLYYSIALNYDNINKPSLAKKYYQLYILHHEDKTSSKYKYSLKRTNEL